MNTGVIKEQTYQPSGKFLKNLKIKNAIKSPKTGTPLAILS
jgi:hypothetical protein